MLEAAAVVGETVEPEHLVELVEVVKVEAFQVQGITAQQILVEAAVEVGLDLQGRQAVQAALVS